jgi:hypothetical protein
VSRKLLVFSSLFLVVGRKLDTGNWQLATKTRIVFPQSKLYNLCFKLYATRFKLYDGALKMYTAAFKPRQTLPNRS